VRYSCTHCRKSPPQIEGLLFEAAKKIFGRAVAERFSARSPRATRITFTSGAILVKNLFFLENPTHTLCAGGLCPKCCSAQKYHKDEEPVRFHSDFHSAPEGRNMPAPQLLDVLVEAQIIAQTLQSIHISHLIPDHTPHATKNKN